MPNMENVQEAPPAAPFLPERHTKQLDALLAQLENFGMIVLELDQSLSNGKLAEQKTFEYLFDRYHLPESGRKRCRQAIEKYLLKRKEAQKTYDRLCNELAGRGIKCTPESTGKFFESATDLQGPSGTVTLEVREAYFLLTFHDEYDYQRFRGEMDGAHSSGTFHRSIQTDWGSVSVLAVMDFEDRETRDAVIIHERQHFINQELADIYSPEAPEHDRRLIRIKDEMLAYLRDGNDMAAAIETIITSKLYSHLWAGFSQGERERTAKLLQSITTKLPSILDDYPTLDPRVILVGMLMVTPLSHWPKRIDSLLHFRHRDILKNPTKII